MGHRCDSVVSIGGATRAAFRAARGVKALANSVGFVPPHYFTALPVGGTTLEGSITITLQLGRAFLRDSMAATEN